MAAPAVAERLLTAEEFLASPDDPEGRRRELLNGRVVVLSHPTPRHGNSAWGLLLPLHMFTSQHRLGIVRNDVGFILRRDPDRVVAPDAAFISIERLAGIDLDKFYPVPPNLAIEVKSRDDSNAELLGKIAEYLAAGSERVWAVRPEHQTVTVFFADGEVRTLRSGDTLASDEAGFAVQGFSLPVADIFSAE